MVIDHNDIVNFIMYKTKMCYIVNCIIFTGVKKNYSNITLTCDIWKCDYR